ncbi:hypothetical protein [Bdellovibrio sp. BCCA]|uniref:hypothetical protein n=1 Tax=Bdellovibrio sp. BCCA TaxID=3136281 RepID=UPI0030F19D8A
MKMKWIALAAVSFLGLSAQAGSNLEGEWRSEDGKAVVRLVEFNGKLTLNTRSYYSNGAPSDYFFEFRVPTDRDVRAGEILQGRLRSIDGYYGCVFDEEAQAQLAEDGKLKLHYPLLTFHRETRSVRQGIGVGYRRVIDWNGWGWVETIYSFPIERWRTISSECVVDAKNWSTGVLVRGGLEIPVPPRPN